MPEIISQTVGGKLASATAEFTRPANTTAYTAGDVVSNDATTTTLMTFTGLVSQRGGSGYIVKAKLQTDKKDETAQYRLILYSVSTVASVTGAPTVSVPGDNAPDTTIYANRLYRVGHIDFPACTAGADTSNNTGAIAQWTGAPLSFRCYQGNAGAAPNAPGDNALYGKLVNMTGTTPASGQNFSVTLQADQNS